MTIRTDSYSSTSEVKAMTRHLLDGQTAFNSTTRPTSTELEKFIDRASGALNVALSKAGLTTPVSNTTAKLLCDDWVTAKSVQLVELTQRGEGFSGEAGSRVGAFSGLYKEADAFAEMHSLGFKRLGVGVAHPSHEGLAFTGLIARADRGDPSDSGLTQPAFRRDLFDARTVRINGTGGSQ
jgi:hypothetical protein